mmetsp:Transcript_2866/g.5661  ORF Transcript_2866/g.5661 Transcript_2866/m.5661 type:complete len:164 (+) Transcript_2866:45-536(+)
MEGKRKRNNNEDDQADVSLVVSWDTLLHPDFEELGRQFPAFRQARQEMEERRQAAIRAVAGKKDPQQRQQSSSASPYHIKHKHLVAWETYLTPTLAWHLTRALLKVHWGLQLLAATAAAADDDVRRAMSLVRVGQLDPVQPFVLSGAAGTPWHFPTRPLLPLP